MNCVLCAIRRSQASSDLRAQFPSASTHIVEVARLGDLGFGGWISLRYKPALECKHISLAGLKGSRRDGGEGARL